MRRWGWGMTLTLAVGLLVGGDPAAAQTVVAASHFDSGSEGWLIKELPYPSPGDPPVPQGTVTPTWLSTGGNPGGHLRNIDPTGNASYWYAPVAFLGNKSSVYGGTLSFQKKISASGTPFSQEDVILRGAGLTLVRGGLALPSSSSFTPYTLDLLETGWKKGSVSGPNATAAEMQAVLGNLSDLYIRAEHRLAPDDAGYLDNVVMTSAASPVPEPGSLLLFLPALAVVGCLRRRRPA